MNKDFDDKNWKQEILGSFELNQSKFASKLLKNFGREPNEDNCKSSICRF